MSEPINVFSTSDGRAVVALAMSWDGESVAVATDSKRVELWSVEGKRLGDHSAHRKPIESIAMADDQSVIASLSVRTQSDDWIEELLVWDRHCPMVRRITPTFSLLGFRSPVFLPGTGLLAVDSNQPRIYDARTAQQLSYRFPGDLSCESLAFSPDGTVMALALDSGPITLWNRKLETAFGILEGHSDAADKLAFSEDGSLLASTSWDDTFRIWDLASAQERRCINAPCQELFHLGFVSPSQVWLLADRKHGFRIFGLGPDDDSQAPLPTRGTITALGTSRVGGLLAIGRVNGRIEIWYLADLVPDVVLETVRIASIGQVH